MAQYLLLEFDNDEQCQKLMDKIREANAAGRGFRVLGLFQKPTRFCECPEMNLNTADYEGRMYDHRKLRRGAKFGWLVHHPGCNRAVKRVLFSPRNLLDPNPDFRWDHSRHPVIKSWAGFPLTVPTHMVVKE